MDPQQPQQLSPQPIPSQPTETVPIASPHNYTTIVFLCLLVIVIAGCIPVFLLLFSHKKTQSAVVANVSPSITPVPSVSYPHSVFPALAQADITTKQRALSQQFGKDWYIVLDSFGLPKLLQTTDPEILGQTDYTDIFQSRLDPIFSQKEIAYWSTFLLQHESLLGIDPGTPISLTYVKSMTNSMDYLVLKQQANGVPLFTQPGTDGEIVVRKNFATSNTTAKLISIAFEGHFWPHLQIPKVATISQDSILKQFIGTTVTIPNNNMMPCDPAPHFPCALRTTTPTVIVISKDNITVDLLPYLVKGQKAAEGVLVYRLQLKNDPYWKKLINATTGKEL